MQRPRILERACRMDRTPGRSVTAKPALRAPSGENWTSRMGASRKEKSTPRMPGALSHPGRPFSRAQRLLRSESRLKFS